MARLTALRVPGKMTVKTASRRLVHWLAISALLLLPVAASAQTACTVTFRLHDAVSAASLQFDVAYDRADLEITGSSDSVSCANLAPALGTFTDDDSGATGTLQVAYIAPTGFAGPRDLLVCDFTTSNAPLLTDFTVTVLDATDTSYKTIVPLPTVVPSQVDCGGAYNTTTTTSTTMSTTTSTIPDSQNECTLEFSLTNAVTLGSLQWEVDYVDAPGEFGGSAAGVQCQNKVMTAFGSMQDKDSERRVITALISLAGFTGPRLLTSCTFLADAYPEVGDFGVTVKDAADPNLHPVNPPPEVVLSNISCAGDTTTTTSTTTTTLPICGNGFLDDEEECDDGPGNGIPGGCRLDCLIDRVCGDGDGNGIVNVTDAQWVLKSSIGVVSPCPLLACDTTTDFVVTVSDSQRVLFRSVGLLAQLVCEP
jgi:hypothetical protein